MTQSHLSAELSRGHAHCVFLSLESTACDRVMPNFVTHWTQQSKVHIGITGSLRSNQVLTVRIFKQLRLFGHVTGAELYPSHKHRLSHNSSHLVCCGMKPDRGALRPAHTHPPSLHGKSRSAWREIYSEQGSRFVLVDPSSADSFCKLFI